MQILTIILSTLFQIVLVRKKIANVSSRAFLQMYIVVWVLCLTFSSLGLMGLYKPSLWTILLCELSVFSLILGFTRRSLMDVDFQLLKNILHNKVSKIIGSKIFIICVLVLTVYVISKLIIFRNVVAFSTLSELRTDFYEGSLYGSDFELMNPWLLYPFSAVTLPILGYSIIYCRNWLTWILLLFHVIYASLGGGRLNYFTIIAAVMLAFILFNPISNRFQFRFKQVFIVGVIAFGMFSFMSLLTGMRMESSLNYDGNSKEALSTQLVTYTGGCISALDHSINQKYVDQINGYKLGTLTFAGAENWFYTFASKVGCSYQRPIDSFGKIKQDNYIAIGDGLSFNALYTWNLWFFCDFGVLGVFLLPFIIGILFRKCIVHLCSSGSIFYYFLLYILFWKTCWYSVMDSNLSSANEFLIICVFLYLGRKDKVRLNNRKQCKLYM